MKLSIISFVICAIRASQAFDIGSKLTGGVGYEYEKEETRVAVDISHNCVSCKVYGDIGDILDGKPSTKLILEANSNDDIDSDAIEIYVDVRYNTRKIHLNHLSITSGDESFYPSDIYIMARDQVGESWTPIHQESTLNFAGNDVKKQIMFNNYNSYFEYRLIFMKKASTEKIEISDCNIINMITSSLAAVTYYKITDTMLFSPSTLQPQKGFVIGMINNPSKNFIVSVNIVPRDEFSTYSNIYCFKDDPTSDNTQPGPGNTQPGLHFENNRIYSSMKVNGRYISVSTPNILKKSVEHTVVTKVLGNYMTLYVDGQVIGSETVNYAHRGDFSKLYAFVSNNNNDPPANAEFKGLRFINLKND